MFNSRELQQNECKIIFFSKNDDDVLYFADTFVSDPLVIRLLTREEYLGTIKEYYVNCENQEKKYDAITNIYGVLTIGQAIIFCKVLYFIIHIKYIYI